MAGTRNGREPTEMDSSGGGPDAAVADVCWGRKVSLSPLLFQESAAAMKATPRTPSIATCVCAVTGDTVKGEW